MKNKIVWMVLAAFLVTPLAHAADDAGQASTEQTSGKNGEHAQKMRDKMKEKSEKMRAELNLTDEQKKQLDDNREKNKEKRKVQFEKLKSQRDALSQELMQPELDMNKINGIQSQIKALESEMADNRLNSILEVRKILTPEQFKKFNTMMEKRRNDRFSGGKDHKSSKHEEHDIE